jgi:outer membrane protein TolC
MLQRLLNSEQAARSDIEIARRQSKPVFSVGVDTRVYSGGNFRETTVGAKMTIPLFNRSLYRANVERAQDQRESAEKEIEALERDLRAQLISAYTDAENAAHQAATFTTEVIPRAERAAESVQNAWISSKANLLETLEARRAVVNARLEQRRLVAAHSGAIETLRSIIPPKSQL